LLLSLYITDNTPPHAQVTNKNSAVVTVYRSKQYTPDDGLK